jgi:hypothetical protein
MYLFLDRVICRDRKSSRELKQYSLFQVCNLTSLYSVDSNNNTITLKVGRDSSIYIGIGKKENFNLL